MGFQRSEEDASPPDRVQLRVVDHKRFQLMTPFTYVAEDHQVVNVPKHDQGNDSDTTDLASVPRLLWGILPSYGRQLRAALMHDHLCNKVNLYPPGKRKEAATLRRRADYLFREAMRNPTVGETFNPQNRVSWFRSWIFWAGVSFGRIWKFYRIGGLLLTLQVLLGVVSAFVMFRVLPMSWLDGVLPLGLGEHRRTYAAAYLATLLLSFVWVGNARVPLIGLLIGPVVLPVLLVTLIAQFLLGVPDLANRLLRGGEEPKASFGPVLAIPQRELPAKKAPGSTR